jgi:hypothetical protein
LATVLALTVVAPAALTVFVPPTLALPTGPACAVATALAARQGRPTDDVVVDRDAGSRLYDG